MMDIKSLEFSRTGGDVKRYHTWPTLTEQTVAAHRGNVAMICAYLAGAEPPGIGAALLMAALTHDDAEQVFGDMPAPAKRALPGYVHGGTFREVFGRMEQAKLHEMNLDWEPVLTDQEKRWLNLADAVEGCFHCIRERALGNKLIAPVWANYINYVAHEHSRIAGAEVELVAHLYEQWSKYDGPFYARNHTLDPKNLSHLG